MFKFGCAKCGKSWWVGNPRECICPEEKPKREWVGLTKKEFNECVDGLEDLEDCWTAIEAKLKEKNT